MSIEKSTTFTFVRCANCGLVYLNPRLESSELHAYYPSYYLPYRGANAWGKYRALAAKGLAATDRKRVRIANKYLLHNQGANVLDIGCGRPTFLELLTQHHNVHATGIDFSDEGWREDPQRWEQVELIRQDPKLFEPKMNYDVMTMWHYLEHDYQPRQTLTGLRKAAHAKTRLLVEVPDLNSLSRKWFGTNWEGFHTPRHTAVYTPSTLRRLLERSGWQIESQFPYGTLDPYVLWWMSRMEEQQIDWRESMEKRFPAFLAGKILTWPLFLLNRWLSLGVQLAVAIPQKS